MVHHCNDLQGPSNMAPAKRSFSKDLDLFSKGRNYFSKRKVYLSKRRQYLYRKELYKHRMMLSASCELLRKCADVSDSSSQDSLIEDVFQESFQCHFYHRPFRLHPDGFRSSSCSTSLKCSSFNLQNLDDFPRSLYRNNGISSVLPSTKEKFKSRSSYEGWKRPIYVATRLLHCRVILLTMLMAFFAPLLSARAISPPPNYSQANMPKTNFTCSDKATGGYYADPEAGCQMFHVCVRISDEEMNDFRFLCPNDTVFDQQNFICTNWWEIDCQRSTRYYSKNDLFKEGQNEQTEYDYENNESPAYYEYVYEYVDSDPTDFPAEIQNSQQVQHRFSLGKSAERAKEPFVNAQTSNQPAKISITSSQNPFPKQEDPKITTHRPSNRLSLQPSSASRPTIDLSRPRPSNSDDQDSDTEKSSKVENEDSEDTFSVHDWRKDSSGVTSSAKTRYEALFGRSSSRGRKLFDRSAKDEVPSKISEQTIEHRSTIPSVSSSLTTEPIRKPKALPKTEISELKSIDDALGGRSKTEAIEISPTNFATEVRLKHDAFESKLDETASKPKTGEESQPTRDRHKAFSNFRFYKTAFGRSYSSDDYLRASSGTTAKPLDIAVPIKPEGTTLRNRTLFLSERAQRTG